MRYESSTEQTTCMQPFTVEDFKQNPEIRRTRSILLILVLIHFAIEIIIANILLIFIDKSNNSVLDWKDRATESMEYVIFHVILPLIYFIIFIMVIIEYKRTGILICAWLYVIILIRYLLKNFFKLAGIAANSSSTINRQFENNDIVIRSILIIIVVLLLVLIIFFAFKLAKLMKRLTTNEIV